jgi:hypothetical protein
MCFSLHVKGLVSSEQLVMNSSSSIEQGLNPSVVRTRFCRVK